MNGRRGISPEIKVGLFVLMGLLILGYMSIKVTKYGIRVKKGYEISAIFDSVSGLVRNASVEIAGVEIGRVKDIRLEDRKAKVIMNIAPEVRLRKGSQVLIRTKGVLGDKFVEVIPGTEAEEIKAGEVIIATTSPSELDQMLTKVLPVLDDIKSVTNTLSEVVGTEEGRESFKELRDNFREVSASIKTITQQIEEGKGTFGKLIKDETIYTEAKETIAHWNKVSERFERIAKDIDAGKGTLGKLVRDDTMYVDAKETIANLKKTSQRIDRGEGTLGKLIKDDTLYEEAKDALKSVRKATEGVQEQTPISTLGVIGAAAIR